MNKVLLAVFGLVAAVQAASEIVITPKHFLKLSTPKSLLQSLLKPKLTGTVTWGECLDKKADKAFEPDFQNTYSKPAVPTKGSNVELELHGTFTEDV
jgi:hypothetical protein